MERKIKCGTDPSIGEDSNCAWCCIHCKEENCEYRCPISIKCNSEDDINCEYV